MGSRVQKNVRSSVEYVCSLLTSLGMAGLCAETLRQGKFNCVAVADCLLRAMHDLILLHLARFPTQVVRSDGREKLTPRPGPRRRKEEGGEVRAARAVLEELWRTVGEGEEKEVLAFVKFYLALWGFPSHSPIFSIGVGGLESRHLLLALGWLISHCKALERGFHVRILPFLAARDGAPLPSYYPVDVAGSAAAVACGKQAEAKARGHVHRLLSSLQGVSDGGERREAKAHQALMLYGKVQAAFKSLHALGSCKARRVHELCMAQAEAGVEKGDDVALSQYEIHLLQHKEELQTHLDALQAEKRIWEEVEEYEAHEELFWEWMESVVHEAAAGDDHQVHVPHLDGVSAAELHPLIQFLHQQPHDADDDDYDGVDGIHRLPPHIARRLQEVEEAEAAQSPPRHQGRVAWENIPFLGLGVQPFYIFSSSAKAAASAEDKLQGLTDLTLNLARVLARVRAKNRAVIQKILQPLLEDQNYVITGL